MSQKNPLLVWTEKFSIREDEVPQMGLVLHEEIRFKQVHDDLIRLLSSGATDENICLILDLTKDLLERFKPRVKRKIKKIEVDLGLPVETEQYECSFWDFVAKTTGDIDLLGWQSFYSCLDLVTKELTTTIHSVDKSIHQSWESRASGRGIFFQRPDLIRLLRTNFKRKYHQDVVSYVHENKVNIFRIDCKQTDKTTLLPPKETRVKGQKLEVRAIRFIQVKILEDTFLNILKKRRSDNQIERDKFIELNESDVMLPPYGGKW